MKQLFIATSNKAKQKEIKQFLKQNLPSSVKIITLSDIKIKEKPVENGKTFKENAFIKAQFYYQLTKIPTIADDAGLTIPSLNNQPGILSRRWLGYEAPDKKLIEYTLLKLKNNRGKERTAYFQLVICLYNQRKAVYSQAKIESYIAKEATKNFPSGFPYRALLLYGAERKYYFQLSKDEKRKNNHRFIALKKLLPKIKKSLLE